MPGPVLEQRSPKERAYSRVYWFCSVDLVDLQPQAAWYMRADPGQQPDPRRMNQQTERWVDTEYALGRLGSKDPTAHKVLMLKIRERLTYQEIEQRMPGYSRRSVKRLVEEALGELAGIFGYVEEVG